MNIKILILLTAAPLVCAPIVDLAIQERAGVDRVDEPVLMGVPLPEEMNLSDTSLFTLRDNTGAIIPCEFRAACRHLKTPSAIRWLHLDFKASVNALQTKTVTLHGESAPAVMNSRLAASDLGGSFEINTGALRFRVKKANFNVIDEAWIDESGAQNYGDANRIIAPHSKGLVHVDSAGAAFLSALDSLSTVILERKGPHSLCLKAAGVLKSASGDSSFHFITRLYAYNESPVVKISSVIEYRSLAVQSYITVASLNIEIPLALSAARRCVAASPSGLMPSVSMAPSDSASVFVIRSGGNFSPFYFRTDGCLAPQAVDITASPAGNIGILSVDDAARGCAAALRYFWQMFPSSISVDSSGVMALGLYSGKQGQVFKIYAGVSRTREARLSFFNSRAADQILQTAGGGLSPLYAVAPASWYCRSTRAFGPVTEKNMSLILPAWRTQVQAVEDRLDQAWDTIRSCIRYYPRLGNYNYGFLRWGDALHRVDANKPGAMQEDWNLVWDGNYYGLPHISFVRFARTADLSILDFAVAHALHVEDVHQVHCGPGELNVTGGCRYCPPTNHIAADGAESMIQVDDPSHHKTQELFENYYLTGSERALDVAFEGADWIQRKYTYTFARPGEDLGVYIRRLANLLFSTTTAYAHTRDRDYHTTLFRNWYFIRQDIINADSIGQTFMEGLFYEALADMYFLCDDSIADSIPKYLKIQADRHYNSVNSNAALGYAFLSSFYGDVYRNRAVSRMNIFQPYYDDTYKVFALYGRNLDRSFFYFAVPDSVGPLIRAEKGPARPCSRLACSYPNPFPPGANFRVTGAARAGALELFDTRGRLVHEAAFSASGDLKVLWKAGGAPSGLYFIRIRSGAGLYSGKVVLMR